MKTLLQRMIRAASTREHGEWACAEVVGDFLTDHGVDVRLDRWDGKRANVTVQLPSARRRPGLMVVCHLDVVPPGEVPWRFDPFCGRQIDGEICGRGATDMKGPTAAVLEAIGRLVRSGRPLQGDLFFAATAGEETDSCGVRRYVERLRPRPALAGILIPEPTDFQLVRAHRGLLWLRVTTRGRTAHASQPDQGLNAIESMRAVMARLDQWPLPAEEHPLLGRATRTITTLAAGRAFNVIPDRCTLGLDGRTLPGQEHRLWIEQLQALLDDLMRDCPPVQAELEVVRSVEALETPADDPFVQAIARLTGSDQSTAAPFTTDGPFLRPLGAPILIFGPGQGRRCHQPDESIAWADVQRAADVYHRILEGLLC